ncbi:hypothetical protein COOONC_03674 [Cooperia oncophora]
MSSSPCSSRSPPPRRNFPKKSRQDDGLCATSDVPIINQSQIDDLNSTKLGEGTYGYVIKCRFRPTPDSLWENIAIKYGNDSRYTKLNTGSESYSHSYFAPELYKRFLDFMIARRKEWVLQWN